MKKFFLYIRHNDIDAVRTAITKNPNVVNEYFDGKAPKKDVGQSPLQVAIKCGQFEIIKLLLENGADADFMEDPALVPPHSVCMSVINDAIIGAMDSLLYKKYESSEKYVMLIETLLEKGADPNKKSFCVDTSFASPPVGTLVAHARENLSRYSSTSSSGDTVAFEASKKNLFTILDLLKKYGADFDYWFDYGKWGDETNRAAFLDAFVPKQDEPYEIKYRGRIIKGVQKGDIDWNKEIRAALREYFKMNRPDRTE